MKLFRSKQPPIPRLRRDEALACVPEIVPAVSWRHRQSGFILIEYPLPLKPLLRAVFERFSPNNAEQPTKKLELDAMGSQVWQLIDGTNTVAEIITTFAQQANLTPQEAEQSVTAFLRELGKRGLIILR